MESPITKLITKFAYSATALVWTLIYAVLIFPIFIMACWMLWTVCCTTTYIEETSREIEMNNRNEHGNRGAARANTAADEISVTQAYSV